MGDLTKNFSWSEFNHSSLVPGYFIPKTNKNVFGVEVLCIQLMQPIRDYVDKTVTVTSGIRDMTIYEALRNARYPASRTSDHFFWCELNPIGSGACDFTFPNFKKLCKKVFHFIIDKLMYNQVILYPDKNFIHVSTDREHIFRYPIKSRRPILIYRNGTYRVYKRER